MYIIGGGGHSKVVIDILRARKIQVRGIFDDNENIKDIWSIERIGKVEEYNKESCGHAIVAVGNNIIRKKIVDRIEGSYGKALHQTAIISESVDIGEGTVVMGGTVINADTSIGKHAIINTSASVDHDCQISDFSHIAPNSTLCGGITIGEGTLIGSGAVVIPNISIGKWVTIGAGAVVTKDIPDYAVVVGNPGRIIKYNDH